MPYIPNYTREFLSYCTLNDVGCACDSPGKLNYAITTICDVYLGPHVSYARINEIIGVLECAKMELYRRVAVSYEDKKIQENGDVYRTRV